MHQHIVASVFSSIFQNVGKERLAVSDLCALCLDLELFRHKTFPTTSLLFLAAQARVVPSGRAAAFITFSITNTFSKSCYFPPLQRESLDMGCVTSSTVPKHCATQVHSGDAALSGAERAAAALSAAPRRVCHRRRHFRLRIA